MCTARIITSLALNFDNSSDLKLKKCNIVTPELILLSIGEERVSWGEFGEAVNGTVIS